MKKCKLQIGCCRPLLWIARFGVAALCLAGMVLVLADPVPGQEVKAYCEWREGNMAVPDPCPEFYWEVEGQTHCRVLVDSTTADLDRDRGGLWDSGKVETILPALEYAGVPLTDAGAYYWKARIWTTERPEGFWTAAQTFRLKTRPPLPARWGHVRLFHQFAGDGEWVRRHSDTQWNGESAHGDHPEWKRLIMRSGLFATMVIPSEKSAALERFCAAQGSAESGILESMFLHLNADANVALQRANMDLTRETRVVPGWDPRNDRNGDGRVDDGEFADLVGPGATARTMSEARLPIYYWSSNGEPDGPRDYIMNVGDPDYQQFVATVYIRNALKGSDGFWSDTCHLGGIPHMYAYSPKAEDGEVGVLEYPPDQKRTYDTDLLRMLARIKLNSPDKIVTGNGWYSNPCVMDGCYFEHLYHIGMDLEELEPIIERAEEIERRGKLQWLMFTPSLALATPDWKRDGEREADEVSPDRERMFALGVYSLIHGRYSYFTIGRHGLYGPEGAKKLWFDGIGVDIGEPAGPRYVFEEKAPAEVEGGENLLRNGNFEGGLDIPGWETAGPVSVVEEFPQAHRFCASVETKTQTSNYINRQYVDLKPHTLYRLSFRMKTQGLAGTAQVYPYEFEGADYGGSALRCSAVGTTPWTGYSMTFKTGAGGRGRINFRINKGRGKAWFDDIVLTEGGSGERWKVMARRFTRGLVLVRVGSAGSDPGDRSARAFRLDRRYRRVTADGTLGEPTREVALRNTEAAVLLLDE